MSAPRSARYRRTSRSSLRSTPEPRTRLSAAMNSVFRRMRAPMFPQHLSPEKTLILGVFWGGLFSRQPPSGRLLFLAIKARAWIVSSVRRLILGSGTGVFEIAVAARDVDLVFYRPAVMAR